MKASRITKLDGLRGVFSLMVLFFHYRENMLPDMIYNNFFIRESYLFVDFFFVLSGYVIALNYHNLSDFTSLKIYLRKRFLRLYPLLLFTTLIAFGFSFASYVTIIITPNLLETLSVNMKEEFFYFLDTILLTNSTPILGPTAEMNTPSWSISSEFIAYTFFGVLALCFSGVYRNIALLATIILACIFSYSNMELFPFSGEFGFVRGLISFNLGYFVWYFSSKKINIPDIVEYIIPIALIGLFYILNSFDFQQPEKQILGLFITPLFFSSSIFILLQTNGIISRVMNWNIFQKLGAISYSLYLNHWVLVLIIPSLIFRIFNISHSFTSEVVVFIITTLIAICYSVLTYNYIEIKCARFLKSFLKKRI